MADDVFRTNYERRMAYLDEVEQHGMVGAAFREAATQPLPCGCVPRLSRAKLNTSGGGPALEENQAGAEFVCPHGWRVRVLVVRDRIAPE